MALDSLVAHQAARRPNKLAVRGPDGALTYGELDAWANALAHALQELGVRKGDRVGVLFPKSCRALVAMQAIPRTGAAYVPIDPLAPPARGAQILRDAGVEVVVGPHQRVVEVSQALPERVLRSVRFEDSNQSLAEAFRSFTAYADRPPCRSEADDDDLAYILYTSGSTGTPKGVCISHENAAAFVRWAASYLQIQAEDRLGNHAPFHFDISVLDIYASFFAGASVHLLPEGAAYAPDAMLQFIQQEQLTVWYSVPSALILMMNDPRLLTPGTDALRTIVFAGEPFPMHHLRRLRQGRHDLRLINMYGPTETNVCTAYELPESLPVEATSIPIGHPCCGDKAWAVRSDGGLATSGEEGELYVSGPTVMLGYWGKEPLSDRTYATGDLVRVMEDGGFEYIGRRDQMVKIRGHRVELAEIEAVLAAADGIKDVAVALSGAGLEARLVVFAVPAHPGARVSLLSLKRHCSARLPRYMIPDQVVNISELPRSRNGKLDRAQLLKLLPLADSA